MKLEGGSPKVSEEVLSNQAMALEYFLCACQETLQSPANHEPVRNLSGSNSFEVGKWGKPPPSSSLDPL